MHSSWISVLTREALSVPKRFAKKHSQHTQTKDWTIHFNCCSHSAFLGKVNQYRASIPFSCTGRCIPKTQKKVHYKINNYSVPTLQISLQETFFPPLWQPLTVIYHHKTTHDQVFSRLHLLSYLQKAVLFTFCPNQNRDFLDYHCLLLLTVQISVHVHAARFGVVWNSFLGFA